MRKLTLVGLVVGLVAVFGAVPVAATPPATIHAEGVPTGPASFDLSGDVEGPVFYVAERGVTLEAVCGTETEPCIVTLGEAEPLEGTLFGVFVEPPGKGGLAGTWTIQGGTGDLFGAHGHGTWEVMFYDDGSMYVEMHGTMHFQKGGKKAK